MRTIVLAALLAFGILLVVQTSWMALLLSNLKTGAAVPWSVPAMGLILAAVWQLLRRRPDLLRARAVPPKLFGLAVLAGACTIAALSAYWIVFSQLVKIAPNALPSMANYPLYTVVLIAIMAALVSPLCEEAAFRGYCQVLLERRFNATVAIGISSILFMLAHLTQGAFATKLFVYLLFGIAMGTTAYLTQSILPGIVVHVAADLTFFLFVWPFDAARTQVWNGGADAWFWLHVVQAVVFTPLAIASFIALRNASCSREARVSPADSFQRTRRWDSVSPTR